MLGNPRAGILLPRREHRRRECALDAAAVEREDAELLSAHRALLASIAGREGNSYLFTSERSRPFGGVWTPPEAPRELRE